MAIIDIFTFNIDNLLVWLSKFNPERILRAICNAGKSVWDAWRCFFFGINFNKHEWALDAFMPYIPSYTEQMEDVYSRITADVLEEPIEDLLELDFEVEEYFQRDVLPKKKKGEEEDGPMASGRSRGEDDVQGEASASPSGQYGPGGNTYGLPEEEFEPVEAPPEVGTSGQECSDDPVMAEAYDKVMDIPHPNDDVYTGFGSFEQLPVGPKGRIERNPMAFFPKYDKKEARQQRKRVRAGRMGDASNAIAKIIRTRHSIPDGNFSQIDEVAYRNTAQSICQELQINSQDTHKLVWSASAIAARPGQGEIDSIMLTHAPSARNARDYISIVRNRVHFAGFVPPQDF
jgi:hypothetical protein